MYFKKFYINYYHFYQKYKISFNIICIIKINYILFTVFLFIKILTFIGFNINIINKVKK